MPGNPAQAFRPDPGAIPDQPGCYQFKDADGRVVYVGKAKSLRQRLANYFQAWHLIAPRTQAMLEAARSVEWIVVATEVESLHLEYTLIKKYRPRYNIRYVDDKSYPYLVVTTSEDVPRAMVSRGQVKRDDRSFGPYANAYAIRETLQDVLRVFPIRTCSNGVYDRHERLGKPCLYAHIGKCSAPCVGAVDLAEHRGLVEGFMDFLGGDHDPVFDRLQVEMEDASQRQEYELAARRRDQLASARKAMERQQMVTEKPEDLDVIAIHQDELEAAVQAFFVRRGRVVGRKGWSVDKVDAVDTAQLLSGFLLELYTERDDDVPAQVLVPVLPDEHEALGLLLAGLRRDHRAGQRGRPIEQVRFVVPQRGDRKALMDTVADNARQSFQRTRLKRASDFNARSKALEELQEALGLDEAPLRIECYDISHLAGTEVVASMVVFEDGLPRKPEYRKFKLTQDRNDDFAAMREVMARRFRRLVEDRGRPTERRSFAYPPNLVIIDGGPGQLNAARDGVAAVLAEFGDDPVIESVALCSLAKKFEEIWLPDQRRPVVLPRGSESLYLVQRLRDEAHRFAVTFQRQRRKASITSSALDGIAGVGDVRRKALLRSFGSVKRLRAATIEQLAEVDGISPTLAATVHAHLREGAPS